MAIAVDVDVDVVVDVPVIVAALLNGNDTVGVIDAVDDQGSISFVNIATMRSKAEHARAIGRSYPPVASSLTASITPTTSFPFTSAATFTGAITSTTRSASCWTHSGMLLLASARTPVLGVFSVHPRHRATPTAAPPSRESVADRHAEAPEQHRPSCPRGLATRTSALARRTTWLTLAAAVLTTTLLATPGNCYAEEDSTPSILGYAFEGFGTGIAVGFATGYLATGPKFESREWRTLLWGGGIGALSGLGIGLVLGVVDASTVPNGRGVGFYIMRDSNYGYSVGALAGGVIGALVWAGGGVSKDVLIGLAWGTVIGAGAGMILGAIEGALRSGRGSKAERRTPFQVGLGFSPALEGGAPMVYPTLNGRF